jgi:hypothetical protein
MKVSNETVSDLCLATEGLLDKGNQIIFLLKKLRGTYVKSKETDEIYKVIPDYFESFCSWDHLHTLYIGFEPVPKEASEIIKEVSLTSLLDNPLVKILGFFEFIKQLNNGDIFPVEGIEESAKL